MGTAVTDTRFKAGNEWRFKAGEPSARKGMSLYSAHRLQRTIPEYIRIASTDNRRLTWSGLATHLGLTTAGLSKYRKGDAGRSEADKVAIVEVLGYYESLIEAQLEECLVDKDYATRGIVFALTNQFSDRWSETKTIKHETTDQRLIVQLHPDLAAKLEKSAGESISYTAPIDGVCSVVEDDTDDA